MPSELNELGLRQAQNLIEMLRNDMRATFESKCHRHGTRYGTTSNMAMALLPMVGIEMVGELTRVPPEAKNAAIRRVLSEIATYCQVPAYGSVGYSLWFAYRNGLAHGYFPTQITLEADSGAGIVETYVVETTPTVRIVDAEHSMTPCLDDGDRASYNDHLGLRLGTGRTRWLDVSAQALYMDVDSYLKDFYDRIASDAALQPVVIANRARLEAEALRNSTKWLQPSDLSALRIP